MAFSCFNGGSGPGLAPIPVLEPIPSFRPEPRPPAGAEWRNLIGVPPENSGDATGSGIWPASVAGRISPLRG